MTESDGIVVSDEIRRGVEALIEKCGHAEIIAEDDNQPYVFIDLGKMDLQGYDFDQSEARVILRVHKDFPRGHHYGIVTIPVLTIGNRDPDSTTRNHPQASCLRQAGITDEYLYWSRDWEEISLDDPEDMKRAVAFVRGTLRNPFQNQ